MKFRINFVKMAVIFNVKKEFKMKKIAMALIIVLSLSFNVFAADGAYTVKKVVNIADKITVFFEKIDDSSLRAFVLRDDANRKYILSSVLTALSAGKSVDVAFELDAGVRYIKMLQIHNQ